MNEQLPAVSIGRIIENVSDYYIHLIEAKESFRNASLMFLWGAPGLGKTHSVEQIAERVHEATGKKVIVAKIRLSNFTRTDLVGFMIYDRERERSKWLPPEMFVMDEDSDTINLIFLDEIPDAHEQLQKVVNQIVDEGTVGVHRLPDNCLYILAGNRRTDNCKTYEMPDSTANRLCHYNVQPDFESWRAWAVNHDINPYVLGYLSYDSSRLYEQEKKRGTVAFATPRSWMALSRYLNVMSHKSLGKMYPEICGYVGKGTAASFLAWCQTQNQLPSIDEVFAGTARKYPKTPDALYALVSSLTTYIGQRKDSITIRSLENACRYASSFPVDFAAVFYKNLMEIKEIQMKIQNCVSFQKWMQKNNRYLC